MPQDVTETLDATSSVYNSGAGHELVSAAASERSCGRRRRRQRAPCADPLAASASVTHSVWNSDAGTVACSDAGSADKGTTCTVPLAYSGSPSSDDSGLLISVEQFTAASVPEAAAAVMKPAAAALVASHSDLRQA